MEPRNLTHQEASFYEEPLFCRWLSSATSCLLVAATGPLIAEGVFPKYGHVVWLLDHTYAFDHWQISLHVYTTYGHIGQKIFPKPVQTIMYASWFFSQGTMTHFALIAAVACRTCWARRRLSMPKCSMSQFFRKADSETSKWWLHWWVCVFSISNKYRVPEDTQNWCGVAKAWSMRWPVIDALLHDLVDSWLHSETRWSTSTATSLVRLLVSNSVLLNKLIGLVKRARTTCASSCRALLQNADVVSRTRMPSNRTLLFCREMFKPHHATALRRKSAASPSSRRGKAWRQGSIALSAVKGVLPIRALALAFSVDIPILEHGWQLAVCSVGSHWSKWN